MHCTASWTTGDFGSWLSSNVRPHCRLTITPTGLHFVLHPGGIALHDAEQIDEAIKAHPALCLIRVPSMRSSRPSSRRAMLSFATTAAYLASTQRKQMTLWSALASRAEWAAGYDMPYFLWIGIIDSQPPQESLVWCNENSDESSHVIKVLALMAMLELQHSYDGILHPRYDVVIYTDMDTMPVRSDVSLDAYLDLDPDANIIASSNPRQAIIMNSGVFFVRNTAWSRWFLEGWWNRRCGYKDQLSLWAVLFADWAKRVPEFAARPELFHNYTIARTEALGALVDIRRKTWPTLRSDRWPCEGRCGQILASRSCLVEPLSMPNVLLLPVAPFANSHGRLLPPLQGTGSYGLFCHGACGDMSHLKEKPVGCFRVIRDLRFNESKAKASAQCASCPNKDCALCGYCDVAYRDGPAVSKARFADARSCLRAWTHTKVIAIGWTKTGLTSLKTTFQQIGLLPACSVKSLSSVGACKSVVGGRLGWNVKSVSAAMQTYPHAKFILTVRSSVSWNDSIVHSSAKADGSVAGGGAPGSSSLLQTFRRYNDRVRALFVDEPDRLLEIDLELAPKTNADVCVFIDPAMAVSVPQCHWPFPHKSANCRLHGQELGRQGAECVTI